MPGSTGRRKRDNSVLSREDRASMSSFEWNKIIASVLTAMIVAMASGILAGQLVRPKELEKPVFIVAGAEPTASAPAAEGAAAGPEPIGPLLAKADPKKGEQIAKVCAACHTFNEGLWKPQALIKGTKMTFAGIPKGQDRADVIAYLETLK